jgi:hypothetical protein
MEPRRLQDRRFVEWEETMAGYPGPSLGLPHWWQRHPWVGLYGGWFVIGAVALGVSRFWMSEHL